MCATVALKAVKPAEVFGFPASLRTQEAKSSRKEKCCPFTEGKCTKAGKKNPLGICSFGESAWCTPVCPKRLLENGRVFVDAAKLAFGKGDHKLSMLSEVGVIEANRRIIAEAEVTPGKTVDKSPSGKAYICKIDFVIVATDSSEKISDYCGLELQSVYFSGKSMRGHLTKFLKGNVFSKESARLMDWRSSAQKRLIPQLRLKVEAFKTLSKKLFVAVETTWFNNLPSIPDTDLESSDLIFLVYPLLRKGSAYRMGDPKVVPVQWLKFEEILKEGTPPNPDDFEELLSAKLKAKALRPKRKAKKSSNRASASSKTL